MLKMSFEKVVATCAILVIIAATTHAAMSRDTAGSSGVSGEITSSIPQ